MAECVCVCVCKQEERREALSYALGSTLRMEKGSAWVEWRLAGLGKFGIIDRPNSGQTYSVQVIMAFI